MQLGPRFVEAVAFAIDCHKDQPRKGARIPYIGHPLGVAALVIEDGGSEDQAIAAILHDTVEDCEQVLEATIRENFGDTIADMVMWCTKLPDSAEFVRSRLGEPPIPLYGKRELVWRIGHSDFPVDALTVALADKYFNANAIAVDYEAIGESLWSRFNATRRETLEYYEGLSEVFGAKAASGFESRWLTPFQVCVEQITDKSAR